MERLQITRDNIVLDVASEFDERGDLDLFVDMRPVGFGDAGIDLRRDDVKALRDHLNEVLRKSVTHEWAPAWSKRRRHVLDSSKERHDLRSAGAYQRAICNEYTYVYFGGTQGVEINDDKVMALPACKICEKKVAK